MFEKRWIKNHSPRIIFSGYYKETINYVEIFRKEIDRETEWEEIIKWRNKILLFSEQDYAVLR